MLPEIFNKYIINSNVLVYKEPQSIIFAAPWLKLVWNSYKVTSLWVSTLPELVIIFMI